MFGDGKNLLIRETRAVQAFCRGGAVKRVPVVVRRGYQLHAHFIADTGIFQRDQLIHFGIANVEFLEVFEAAGPHASLVQLPVVGKRMGMATG